jgi:hypothetical protein
MTLTQTLQINDCYLHLQDIRAMEYCEKRWQEEGCPLERWPLLNFIEKMLRELVANGIGYPRVLLLRKKEIQRGQFKPEALKAEHGPEPVQVVDACPGCQGRGFLSAPGSRGTLCMQCLGRGRKIAVSLAGTGSRKQP